MAWLVLARQGDSVNQAAAILKTVLHPELIIFLNAHSRKEALETMIDAIARSKHVPDQAAFALAIGEREALASTGIGLGVAVPHAKRADLRDFFIAVGIQQGPGLEWEALDQAPVRLIFLIGGPDDRQNEYLRILSSLTRVVRDPEIRRDLLLAKGAKEVLQLLASN